MDMIIDKENENCCYNDELHSYWVKGNPEDKFISVTTLIGKFHEAFDEEFWSKYKALEKLLIPEAFNLEKARLLATKKFNMEILDNYEIDKLEFNKTVNEILDGYEENRRIACERGNKFHSEQENKYYKTKKHSLPQYGLKGDFECRQNYYKLDMEKGIYPEYLVYRISPDGVLKVAGQIDLLVKDGNDIYILDYKTNKEIKQKGFFDSSTKKQKTMFYPLNNIPDCNFYHYTLQLSTYAWMIKQMNPDFQIKGLILIHYDHNEKCTLYNLDYREEDVIRMLAFHKQQTKIAYEKSLHNPIIF